MIKDMVFLHECIEAAFSRSRKLGGSHYLIIGQRWLYRHYGISKWWLYIFNLLRRLLMLQLLSCHVRKWMYVKLKRRFFVHNH